MFMVAIVKPVAAPAPETPQRGINTKFKIMFNRAAKKVIFARLF